MSRVTWWPGLSWDRDNSRIATRQRKEARTHQRLQSSFTPTLVALLVIAGVTGLLVPFRSTFDTVDVLVFYLVAVTGIALVANLRSSIAGAAGAFLAFNFFFTTPYHTFFVANTHDVLALSAFLGLSMLISRLVVRTRVRTREALRRSRQTETLYRLSVALTHSNEIDAILASIVERVQHVFSLDSCAVLLADGGAFRVGAATGAGLDLAGNPDLLAAARWSLEHSEPASPDIRQSGATWHDALLVPILTADEPIGVLLVARARDGRPFDDEERRLLVTFANQAALAIERSSLAEQRARAEVLSRTDELRAALLSAVSHDLRTPLASIKASVTTLLQPEVDWREPERRELLEAIDEEADRLNRLVTNLLDLSRIEAGALVPARDWYEPAEIVGDVLERSVRLLEGREVALDLPKQSALIDVDFVMIAEVLANLLENAVKYSPPGTPVRIAARRQDRMLAFSVADRGAGIPEGEEERIFDRFYRVEGGRAAGGAGMGLAICRGFVEAHGGAIRAERNPEGGSTMSFTVPLAGEQDVSAEVLERQATSS